MAGHFTTLDRALSTMVFAWLLYRYFGSPPDSGLRKQKWAPWWISLGLICSLLSLLLVLLPDAPPVPLPLDQADYRYLPSNELEDLVKTKGKLGYFDQTITVRHGPRVLALAGYKHTQPNAGALQLISMGPNDVIIMVSLYEESSDLGAAERRLRNEARGFKPSGTLGPSQSEKIHACEGITMPLGYVTKEGAHREGYAVLVTNGRFLYCLMLSGPPNLRSTWDPMFQRVIRSFDATIQDN